MGQSNNSNQLLPDETPEDSLSLHEEPAERLDSVPDSEQEHPGLDPQTQRRIDSMNEDELDAQARQEIESQILGNQIRAEPERLEQLASASREFRTPQADTEDQWRDESPAPDQHLGENSDGVPDNMQEAVSAEMNPSPTDIYDLQPESYLYVVQAVLPQRVVDMVQGALNHIQPEVNDVEGLQLQAAFLTRDIHSVSNVLDQWARHYLPLPTGLAHVHSEVRGAQQYVAGWRIDNAAAWHEAQNDLTTRLAGLITPGPNATATFRAIVGLIPSTPANDFPKLVAFLQQQFEPFNFAIEAVQICRKPLPGYASELHAEQRDWQVYATFPLSD